MEYEMAKAYYEKCAVFDARVCTAISPRSGEPIPADERELALVNRNARKMIQELAREYCVSRWYVEHSIQRYAEYLT